MVDGKKAVLFDLDGTLIDAFAGIHDALSHTMQALGFTPCTFARTKRLVGRGLERLLADAMCPEAVADAIPLYQARYAQIAVSSAIVLPHADQLLRELAQRGVLLGLASNKPAGFSRQILEGLGWASYFRAVHGPDSGVAPKPDPAMVHALLATLGVSASETLYVGDMEIDLETARAAGVDVVLVATGSRSAEELSASGARVLTRLDALLEPR